MGKIFLYGITQRKVKTEPFAKLTVNCPLGVTVRAVSVDTLVAVDVVSNNGIAVFNRLTEGEWDITFVGVEYAPVKRVKIDTLDNEITLGYFESTINVTYPVGSICTCSNGTTVLTAPDTSGMCAFIVPNLGTWNVECHNTTDTIYQTDSEDVNVTSNGQINNVTLKYFASTINVTYPDGSICTCSNGNIVLTAPDTSGSYTFIVPYVGTWTVTSSNGELTDSEDVNIHSDEQTESIEIGYLKIPVLNMEYPLDVTTTSGNIVSFTAVIIEGGYPTNYTYNWYVDDVLVKESTVSTYERDTTNDRGVYTVRCDVVNKAGVVSARAATMTVNRLPGLTVNYADSITLTVDESTTLSVSIASAGYPDSYTYQWYENGIVIPSATSQNYTYTSTIGDTTDAIYCIVTNGAGPIQSKTATITTDREYLFNRGQFYHGSYDYYLSPNSAYNSVELTDGSIKITADGPGNSTGFWLTSKVNVTNRRKLVFTAPLMQHSVNDTNYAHCGTWYFGIGDIITWDSSGGLDNPNVAYTTRIGGNDSSYQTFVVDVSKITGEYYVKVKVSRAQISYQDLIWIDSIYLL